MGALEIFTTVRNPDGSFTTYRGSGGGGGGFYFFLIFVGALIAVGTMFTCGWSAVFAIIMIVATVAARFIAYLKLNTWMATWWIHPVTVYFMKKLGSAVYVAYNDARLFPLFGYIVLFCLISLSFSFGEFEGDHPLMSVYCMMSILIAIIFVGVHYPDGFVLTPLIFVSGMYLIAALVTVPYLLFFRN